MPKFYHLTPQEEVRVCERPRSSCPHEHHLYLASAARELAQKYRREYHVGRDGEIARCPVPEICERQDHFLKRHEVVRHHRETYDFTGVWRPLVNPYTSLLERELAEVVELLGYQVERNSRNVIFPYELDLYIPELEVAFEFNGAHWHSEEAIQERYGTSAKLYHKEKAIRCEEQGILLGFVWEQAWRQDWVTVLDAVCEAMQFRRRSPLLRSFSKPLAPMEVHFEKVDREGMELARKRLTEKTLKRLEKEAKRREEKIRKPLRKVS